MQLQMDKLVHSLLFTEKKAIKIYETRILVKAEFSV